MKVLLALFYFLLALFYFLLEPQIFGYGVGTEWWTHITYMVCHANILHLLMNLIGYASCCKMNKALGILFPSIVCGFIGAIVGSFLFVPVRLTVGFSGVVYGMFGAPVGWLLISRLRITSNRFFAKYIASVIVGLAIPFLFPGVNAMIHVTSLLISIMLMYMYGFYREFINYMHKYKNSAQNKISIA